jgi:hypothetical protein
MRRVLVGVALLAACVEQDVRSVPLPPAPADARVALIAALPSRLWLVDLDAPEPLPALEDEAQTLAAVYYEVPLSEFRVRAGEVPMSSTGYALPERTSWLTELRAGDDSPPAWRVLDGLPPALVSRLIAPTVDDCPRFETRAQRLRRGPRASLLLPDGSVLLVIDGAHYRATPDGVQPLPALDGRLTTWAELAPDGTLWSFGMVGHVSFGPVDGSTLTVVATPHSEDLVGGLVSANAEGLIVETVSLRGTVARYASGRWTTLVEAEPGGIQARRGLGRTPAGELVVVSRGSSTVHVISATGGVTVEQPEDDATYGYTRVVYVEGLGLVVVRTYDGQALVREGPRRWRRLPGLVLDKSGFAIARDGDRLYVGGARGSMRELALGVVPRVCAVGPLVAGEIVDIHVTGPGTFVLVSDLDGSAAPGVAWLRRL